ncbi:MAG: phosphoribosyl-AMP cyclohydrolase [Gammaproteobacteria bacterium]|jgi:phosphoribosyl-AMP cyclohydrolase|nr:phosphoribosyl-AMP cyclohydrolase [Gammaproteobacteria bacterium]MBT3858300.1 phosphoribosyl-AMP cyclohydrolase [Gammaproteobacteria bacterium]MBT3988577.1 phosphoribosyl-AMP cyclohydrolase [Gammaproteobacteria bacterium]MBT4257358.1 phosphoribosyl-AMP cyclohydrolase [Gammaproteobacteria bacterium]MBT4580485.1 phosphoribosyl-AMP cyclohydrolase [Gammaproteobacteria bacterium]
MSSYLDQIKWNEDGLVPVITQEASSGRVLTQAWINKEALETTVAENRAVYWSRSRSKLWRKGEESGNIQQLVEVLLDCDNDSVCYRVKQIGGIACHTGRESCFYKKLEGGAWQEIDPVLKEPAEMYGNK